MQSTSLAGIGPNGDDLVEDTHSLSWESEVDENRCPPRHGNTLVAKVWTPEDPRDEQADYASAAAAAAEQQQHKPLAASFC